MAYQRLGDLLVSAGVITSEQLKKALEIQQSTKGWLGEVLTGHGFITEKELCRALELQLLEKTALGLMGEELKKYGSLLDGRSGMVLLVGPAGCGKSSTMYTMLRELKNQQLRILCLEDEAQLHLDGLEQAEFEARGAQSPAQRLQAAMKLVPDVIALEELRDKESAELALRAALIGHLVLATMQAPDGAAAIGRLLDMGVEPYLIAGGVRGIISQRLARRVCPSCREAYTPPAEGLERLGLKSMAGRKFFRGGGCSGCGGSGYQGKIGVFEVLLPDRRLRRTMVEPAMRGRLEQMLRESHTASMAENCRWLVLEGITTVEEAGQIIAPGK